MDKVTIIFLLVIFILVVKSIYDSNFVQNFEHYGGLQSLYSNDGIQDIHLTVNNVSDRYGYGYNPYMWRYPWYLPTRGMYSYYYPYMGDYFFDRYGILYPYY